MSMDAKERWSFEVDEVLDLGAEGRFIVKDRSAAAAWARCTERSTSLPAWRSLSRPSR